MGPRLVFSCSEDEDVHTTFQTMKGLECATRRGRAARLRRVISMDLLATNGAVEISQEPRPFTDFGMRVRANQ